MTRALVLSGGGPIGIGWHSGMVAAFTDGGVDVGAADQFIGTSAGSVVGSQLALGRRPLDELKNRPTNVEPDSAYSRSLGDNMQRLMAIMASAAETPAEERIKALCELALDAETVPEERFMQQFAAIGTDGWPKRFVCTAIDTADGSFTTWDEAAKVDPVRAVASSCSVPGFFPPITINGRRYMDGGLRSITNADLAAGHDTVLVLSVFKPLPGATDPRAVRMQKIFDAETQAIEERGGRVEILAPDDEARDVLGINMMDPTRTLEAADAGYAQGRRVLAQVAEFWDRA